MCIRIIVKGYNLLLKSLYAKSILFYLEVRLLTVIVLFIIGIRIFLCRQLGRSCLHYSMLLRGPHGLIAVRGRPAKQGGV